MTADDDHEAAIEVLSNRRRGDERSVYDDIDVESLPAWWQRAIAEHEEYGLRPYCPPIFTDDVIVPPVIEWVGREEGVDVRLQGKNVSVGDPWTVVIGGTDAFEIPRRRDPNGYTVLEISSEEFVRQVETHARDE